MRAWIQAVIHRMCLDVTSETGSQYRCVVSHGVYLSWNVAQTSHVVFRTTHCSSKLHSTEGANTLAMNVVPA